MNLLQHQKQGSLRSDNLGQNAYGYMALEHVDEKYTVVVRPNDYRRNSSAFMEVFSGLQQTCANVTNAHVMRPEAFVDDEQCGFLVIGHTRYIPLGQLLAEKPAIVADVKWVRTFVDDLLDALEHLHKRGLAAVELSPLSVLVRKGGQHELMLMPPASDFLAMRHDVWTRENEYLAPELFATQEDEVQEGEQQEEAQINSVALDIYGAAQLLKRIFKFSTLPIEYQKFVNKASNADPNKRPASISEVRDMIGRARNGRRALRSMLAILFGIAIVGIFVWGLHEPAEPEFKAAPTIPIDSLAHLDMENDQVNLLEDVESMLQDTSYLSGDTALQLSPEHQAEERERTTKSLAAFRSRFTTLARATLSNVYTREKLTGNEALFRQEAAIAMARLQEQADNLADHYQLNYTLAQSEAAKVISRVTDELRRKAMQPAPEQ